jgi:hypothetical protein
LLLKVKSCFEKLGKQYNDDPKMVSSKILHLLRSRGKTGKAKGRIRSRQGSPVETPGSGSGQGGSGDRGWKELRVLLSWRKSLGGGERTLARERC